MVRRLSIWLCCALTVSSLTSRREKILPRPEALGASDYLLVNESPNDIKVVLAYSEYNASVTVDVSPTVPWFDELSNLFTGGLTFKEPPPQKLFVRANTDENKKKHKNIKTFDLASGTRTVYVTVYCKDGTPIERLR